MTRRRVLRLKDKYDRPVTGLSSSKRAIFGVIADIKDVFALGDSGFRGKATINGLTYEVRSNDTYNWEVVL